MYDPIRYGTSVQHRLWSIHRRILFDTCLDNDAPAGLITELQPSFLFELNFIIGLIAGFMRVSVFLVQRLTGPFH